MSDQPTKTCTKCGESRPLDQFGPRKRGKDGKQATCLDCNRLYFREHRNKSPENVERARARCRKWAKSHPDQLRKIRRNTYLSRRDLDRDQHLRRVHGIGSADYERLLESQFRKCATCRRHIDTHFGGKRLHVDHDHNTGAIRGLLCPQCNKALGLLLDHINTLKRMVSYLEDPPAPKILGKVSKKA